MKVSLFVTCLIDQFFPQVGLSTIKILKKFGVEVEFESRQTCCGQPAFNTGYVDETRQVAEHFLKIYRDSHQIVVPSGSCATMIKCFLPKLFPEGSSKRQLAEEIGKRTFELSDFLSTVLGIQDTGARFPQVVTYHDSCHLLRELGISSQPRRLIRSIEEIDFREMKNSHRCCGFGGTFSVKFPDVSAAIGDEKVEWIRDSGARYVIASDVSCLMHIDGLLRRNQVPVQTMHLAELLAQFDD
ncbi:(Fe-S)-binding protein [Acidobacteria bacterium AH-259-D05]|nr:(Fe-S)-binding protein [Acidobacteria bacterium AH-259-D05]